MVNPTNFIIVIIIHICGKDMNLKDIVIRQWQTLFNMTMLPYQ